MRSPESQELPRQSARAPEIPAPLGNHGQGTRLGVGGSEPVRCSCSRWPSGSSSNVNGAEQRPSPTVTGSHPRRGANQRVHSPHISPQSDLCSGDRRTMGRELRDGQTGR